MKKILVLLTCLFMAFTISAQSYKGFVEAGATVSHGNTSVEQVALGNSAELMTSHGVDFGDTWFIGLGTGVQYMKDAEKVSVPIFVDGRVNLSQGLLVPYIGVKAGYSIYAHNEMDGFIFARPTAGLRLGIGDYAMNFGINYQFNWARGTELPINDFQGLGATVGFEF